MFLRLLLNSLALLLCASALANTRPNVLVILVDDMGWSDIGPYGGEIHTPALDSLAANGVRFRHFYNEARCSPTRIALMSGLHMQAGGVDPNASLPNLRTDNNATLAELLGANGYRTYMAGKWHLGPKASVKKGQASIFPCFFHMSNRCCAGSSEGGSASPSANGSSRF